MFRDLQNLFIQKNDTYSRNLQFSSLIIIFVIMAFFITYFPKNYGFVIILIAFAVYLSNEFINIQNTTVSNFNNITMGKLNILQDKVYQHINKKLIMLKTKNLSQSEIQEIYIKNKLDSLYIDANMIHFLESISSLYNYDSYNFYALLKGTNNILKLKKEIDTFYKANGTYPANISEMLETALELKGISVNNIHNFIYSVPKSKTMLDYINKITSRYDILISRVTDSIYTSYNNSLKLNGINTTTKFISYNTTKSYDPKLNHSITNLNKTQHKLLNYYL